MKTRLAQAAALALLTSCLLAPCAQAAFGLNDFQVTYEAQGGGASTQAGTHPDALTTSFGVNYSNGGGGLPDEENLPDGEFKDLSVAQPAGLVGDLTAIEPCPSADFLPLHGSCPHETQVGETTVAISIPPPAGLHTYPVYNLTPPPGVPARLGFKAEGVPVVIDLTLAQAPPTT